MWRFRDYMIAAFPFILLAIIVIALVVAVRNGCTKEKTTRDLWSYTLTHHVAFPGQYFLVLLREKAPGEYVNDTLGVGLPVGRSVSLEGLTFALNWSLFPSVKAFDSYSANAMEDSYNWLGLVIVNKISYKESAPFKLGKWGVHTRKIFQPGVSIVLVKVAKY